VVSSWHVQGKRRLATGFDSLSLVDFLLSLVSIHEYQVSLESETEILVESITQVGLALRLIQIVERAHLRFVFGAGAELLKEFAGEGPWAHRHIAGPAALRHGRGDYLSQPGGTGYGVRLMVELASSLA